MSWLGLYIDVQPFLGVEYELEKDIRPRSGGRRQR